MKPVRLSVPMAILIGATLIAGANLWTQRVSHVMASPDRVILLDHLTGKLTSCVTDPYSSSRGLYVCAPSDQGVPLH